MSKAASEAKNNGGGQIVGFFLHGKCFEKFAGLSPNSAVHYISEQHNSALEGVGGILCPHYPHCPLPRFTLLLLSFRSCRPFVHFMFTISFALFLLWLDAGMFVLSMLVALSCPDAGSFILS